MKTQHTKTLTAVMIGLAVMHSAVSEAADLKAARGSALIAAPTSATGPTNQGVWFVNPMNKAFSLSLPDLAIDQVYEGWIVDDCTGKKISTGIFRASGGIDSDAAGKYAGSLSLNFPGVPGSDFVTLGHDISDGGHNIVITVEPYPDTDPAPSGVAVLRARIPVGTQVGSILTLENIVQ
jgi:hypothetical protein